MSRWTTVTLPRLYRFQELSEYPRLAYSRGRRREPMSSPENSGPLD